MTRKKEAPTRQGQGQLLHTSLSYHTAPPLSMAAQIILLAMQCPVHADRLRAACWNKLEAVLRRYYDRGNV